MPHRAGSEARREGEVNKERPEKTLGGSRVWITEGFGSRLPQLWFGMRERGGSPRRIEVSGGVTRTGQQPGIARRLSLRGLRHPQAGIAGARPAGKVEKSKGNRY